MWKGKPGSVGGGRQVAGPASQLPEVPECSRVLLIVVFVGHCWPDLICSAFRTQYPLGGCCGAATLSLCPGGVGQGCRRGQVSGNSPGEVKAVSWAQLKLCIPAKQNTE